jgi:hypothetical protein
MSRVARLLLLLASLPLLVAVSGPAAWLVAPAHAGTIGSGSAAAISGLDNLASTVNEQAKGGLGKMLGIGVGIGGMLVMAGGRLGTGALAAASGVGMAFVPDIYTTAFDATTAAPLVTGPALVVLTAWWAPALALLWPAVLALKWALDPVVWGSLALIGTLRGAWARRPVATA